MSLSSESIQKKEFHIVFKGYKPEEVDKFLDMLALEFDGMQKKVKELEEKIDSIKYEGDSESSKMKKIIQEALVSAHRMAEEIKQKAKIEAEELVSRKRMEEEQGIRKLQDEKTSLESDISRLKDEYAGFRKQISIFADDFKKKMAGLEDGKLLDAIKGTGIDMNNDSKTSPEVPNEPETPSFLEKEEIEDDAENSEEVIYKHARTEEKEEEIGEKDLKDLAALTDEMLEKLDKTGKKNLENFDKGEEVPSGTNNEIEEEKRDRKKIDIANPDIINDFFKTDDD